MAPFHIRPATPTDVNSILQLITDLAIYEKEPDLVKATPELLKKNLFDTPYAYALLAFPGTAEAPGEAVGLALYFFNYSTWTGKPGLYLEDLYVKPEFRANGIGKAIFGHLGKIAQEKVDFVPFTRLFLPIGTLTDVHGSFRLMRRGAPGLTGRFSRYSFLFHQTRGGCSLNDLLLIAFAIDHFQCSGTNLQSIFTRSV
ncbi:hypothetical protein AX15_003301 [Amanita polypyramis BW_CC]|nr:hypothetical protein AX15_003301 [Amanita polypyramis BW_CC]